MLLISTTILEVFSLHHNLHQKYPYHTSLPHCVKIYFWEIILWSIHRHWSFDTFERSFPNCIANLTCEESLFICKRIEIVFLWVFWPIHRCTWIMYTCELIFLISRLHSQLDFWGITFYLQEDRDRVFVSLLVNWQVCPLHVHWSNHTYECSFLESGGHSKEVPAVGTLLKSYL